MDANVVALAFLLFDPLDVSLDDLHRFPDPLHAATQLEFACEHRRWAVKQVEGAISPRERERCREAATEANRLHRAWDLLADAQTPSHSDRLDALRNLRWWIGDAAYLAGIMPPAVPVWRFTKLPH